MSSRLTICLCCVTGVKKKNSKFPKSPRFRAFEKDRQYETVKQAVAEGTLALSVVMSQIGVYKLLETDEIKLAVNGELRVCNFVKFRLLFGKFRFVGSATGAYFCTGFIMI